MFADMRKLPHLSAIQNPIGDGDTQHISVKLKIKPIHEAQGLEFVLCQIAGQAAFNLLGELIDARLQKLTVNFFILVMADWAC